MAAAPPPPPPPPPPPHVNRILAPAPHAFHIHQLFHDHEHHHHQIPPPPPNELQFVIRTTTLVLVFFLLTLVFSFVAWLLFHPKCPALHVSSARMAFTNTTTAAAAGDCNLTLLLTNPNRHLKAVYERMEISLIYTSHHVLISEHYPPSFVQPRNNRTEVKVDLSFYVGGGVVMGAIKKDVDKGSLGLGLRVFAVLSFRNGRWKMNSQYMRAYCEGLVLGFGSSGKEGVLDNRGVDCEVYLYTS